MDFTFVFTLHTVFTPPAWSCVCLVQFERAQLNELIDHPHACIRDSAEGAMEGKLKVHSIEFFGKGYQNGNEGSAVNLM